MAYQGDPQKPGFVATNSPPSRHSSTTGRKRGHCSNATNGVYELRRVSRLQWQARLGKLCSTWISVAHPLLDEISKRWKGWRLVVPSERLTDGCRTPLFRLGKCKSIRRCLSSKTYSNTGPKKIQPNITSLALHPIETRQIREIEAV